MKLIAPIAALCAFGLFSSDASAYGTQTCRIFLETCNQCCRACKQCGACERNCKMLYDAAIKANGAWGLPEARAATQTHGFSAFCYPE